MRQHALRRCVGRRDRSGGNRVSRRGGGDGRSDAAARFDVHRHGSDWLVAGPLRSCDGAVVVVKSWDGGEHRLITTAITDSHGHYRVAIKLARRGLLTVLIVPPDKHAITYELRVT